jgi:tRNA dimethylallyltransferase
MAGPEKGRAVLIAGPTASGKTEAAIARAQATGASIVNADAMQVYAVLDMLTARPNAAQRASAEHHLFGHVHPSTRYSAGQWLRDAQRVLAERPAQDVIFVGGTGLYFEVLTQGISEIPALPDAVVDAVRAAVRPLDAAERAALLAARDPKMAARLDGFDPQRVVRALAVLDATGRSLADWQDEGASAPLAGRTVDRLVLAPDRAVLRERIAARFAAMLAAGAIQEVEALLKLDLDPELPAMKAIGVRQIAAMLAGEIDRDEAIRQAVNATRQYAKRQMTWFRKHMADWVWVEG